MLRQLLAFILGFFWVSLGLFLVALHWGLLRAAGSGGIAGAECVAAELC